MYILQRSLKMKFKFVFSKVYSQRTVKNLKFRYSVVQLVLPKFLKTMYSDTKLASRLESFMRLTPGTYILEIIVKPK